MNPFSNLTNVQLRSLHAAFRHGALRYGVTTEGLRREGVSLAQSSLIDLYLREREIPIVAAAAIIEAVLQTRSSAVNLALTQTLVITGPVIPDLEILKTTSRFVEVVQHARHELILATFALYQGDQILAPIHDAMRRDPGLQVILILNIPRKYGDTTLSEEIIASFKRNFFSKHWPWVERPAIYFFPPSLELDPAKRATMHAKFVVADGERCFITSANFTEAAQKKNIEVGVELAEAKEASRLANYIHGLIQNGTLHPIF